MRKWVNLLCLVILLGIGITQYSDILKSSQEKAYDTYADKTALDNTKLESISEDMQTGQDILLSLMVLDENAPYPRSIRINDSPIIDLDKKWVANKFYRIRDIYDTQGDYKLGSMLNWRIISVDLIPNNGDPYIQYRLEV